MQHHAGARSLGLKSDRRIWRPSDKEVSTVSAVGIVGVAAAVGSVGAEVVRIAVAVTHAVEELLQVRSQQRDFDICQWFGVFYDLY